MLETNLSDIQYSPPPCLFRPWCMLVNLPITASQYQGSLLTSLLLEKIGNLYETTMVTGQENPTQLISC